VIVYLAGPMSSNELHHYEAYNVEAFEAARRRWEGMGHTVLCPFDANSAVWQDVHGRPFDPYTDRCDWGDPLLVAMFLADLEQVALADAIVLLEGWRHSWGARTELHLALKWGKRVFDDATGLELLSLTSKTCIHEGDK
jgi:hypothetical protein